MHVHICIYFQNHKPPRKQTSAMNSVVVHSLVSHDDDDSTFVYICTCIYVYIYIYIYIHIYCICIMYIPNSTHIYLRFMYICGEFKTDPGDDKCKRLGKQKH